MRSRVTSNCLPTSSSVWSVFMSMPKRMRSTLASRGVSDARIWCVASRSDSLVADSSGDTAATSSMKSPRCESSSSPIGDDEDSHLGDFIEDVAAVSPLESATSESLREATHQILASLTPREAKVLRMRFGIDMNTDHTLEEVGKQFDVTRERIRQIEAKALRKLRHPSRANYLRSFLAGE